MSNKQSIGPPNVITVAITVLVTVCAVGNVISAVLTDSVWILVGSGAFSRGIGTTPKQIFRLDDPLTFYITLGATGAFAAYLLIDQWRRLRR